MDGTLLNSMAVVERVWGAWAVRNGLDPVEMMKTVHGVRAVDTIRSLQLPDIDPEKEAYDLALAEIADVEGIIESGAANNGAVSGAWIPALVFGIPGDSITAIVIGVLYVKGMNPGPTIFIHAPELIYAVFTVFFLANLIMLPLGWTLIKVSKQVLRVPTNVLMPIILMFCIVGSFAINNSVFGIGIMLAMGVLGFLMEENDIPIAPAILGLVLGPMLEKNFITSMIKSDGSFAAFFERPIAAGLGVLAILVWVVPVLLYAWRSRHRAKA